MAQTWRCRGQVEFAPLAAQFGSALDYMRFQCPSLSFSLARVSFLCVCIRPLSVEGAEHERANESNSVNRWLRNRAAQLGLVLTARNCAGCARHDCLGRVGL